MYSIRSLPTVSYRVKREGDGVEDMTQMEYVNINIHSISVKCIISFKINHSSSISCRELTEKAVLINMKTRFDQELIYVSLAFMSQ